MGAVPAVRPRYVDVDVSPFISVSVIGRHLFVCIRDAHMTAGVGVMLERRPETKAVMVPPQLLAWGLAASEAAAAATTSGTGGGYVFW